MSAKHISRQDLLQSFGLLQGRFNQALGHAKEQNKVFENIRTRLQSNLQQRLDIAQKELPSKNPLAVQIGQFFDHIGNTGRVWDEKIAGRSKGISFRENFNDSLLVFVYGKVKSGKSSLGNYVAWGHTDPDADLKNNASIKPDYFSHEQTNIEEHTNSDKHKEAESRQEFRVGATEATSSIQGFKIPGLTWVDSPGLHSVNEANGKLARDYVEHADLILYTMRSDSPGRESDIDEIIDLYRKDKKTVLLITGSDDTEEDWSDEEDALVQTIVMKSASRCEDQRVYVRSALAKMPKIQSNGIEIISFSARYAQLHQNNPQAFEASGMGQLFAVMEDLTRTDGVKIKQQVPMNNFKNFIAGCLTDIKPYYSLLKDFGAGIDDLQQTLLNRIRDSVREAEMEMRHAVSREFDLVSGMADTEKGNAVKIAQNNLSNKVKEITQKQLEIVFEEVMNDFASSVNQTYQSSDLIQLPEFKLETRQQEVAAGVQEGTKGRNAGLGSAGGAALGAALGSVVPVIGTGIGTMVGSFLGGVLGGASGDNVSINYEDITIAIGDNLHDIKQQAQSVYVQGVANEISKQADLLFNNVITQAQSLVQDLYGEVKQAESDFHQLLQNIQSEQGE